MPSDELQTAVTHWGSLPRIAKHRTDFSDCDFRGIKFMNCDLTSVNFRRTKMDKAEFYDSTLVSVIARGNDWQEAFNSEDEPEFKVNRGCTMRGAAFLNCTIHDCEFIGAEMEHCVFTRGTLKRTAFAGCGLRFSQFVKVPAKNLLFYRTNLMHSSAVDGCNFQNIDIHGSSHIRGLPADETIRHQEIAFGQFYSQTRMNWSARF